MNGFLVEAFRYSAWATKTLLAACRKLSADELDSPARGYGSILATLNHVVLSDAGYVAMLTGVRPTWASAGSETDDLAQLEARVHETVDLWEQFLAKPLDADRLLLLDKGTYECHASIIVAQALHHANVHREQIRGGLRDLEVELPDVQPWEYGLDTGRARWTKD